MGTMGEISAAINLIDVKKENLRESFLHLQSQSPSSFNFNSSLKWSDLDSYFTTLRFSLQHKFNLLQSDSDTTSVPARPELISLCKNSDGLGLKRFIALAPDRPSLLAELPDAYRYAPDAAAMVLNAIHSGNIPNFFKTAYLTMLEVLMHVKPDISIELKDKAMEIAVEWNRIMVSSSGRAKAQNTLAFLLLVGAYGLIHRFCTDHLIDCFLIVAKKRQYIHLCPQIIPAHKINDVIQKLINKDMHITAVNLSIDLKKTDEFPPVRLLEERKLMCMRVIEETRKNRHVSNEVMVREINTLKSIIKCIDENQLQSEYPKDNVVEVVKKLENEVEESKQDLNLASRKRPAVFKPKPDKLKLNKSIQNVMPIQEPNSQASDHHHHHHVGNSPANAFYVPQSHTPSAYNSNGWISD